MYQLQTSMQYACTTNERSFGKCKGRRQHGEIDDEAISIPPKLKLSVISEQTTSPSVQKRTEIQITWAIIAMNARF